MRRSLVTTNVAKIYAFHSVFNQFSESLKTFHHSQLHKNNGNANANGCVECVNRKKPKWMCKIYTETIGCVTNQKIYCAQFHSIPYSISISHTTANNSSYTLPCRYSSIKWHKTANYRFSYDTSVDFRNEKKKLWKRPKNSCEPSDLEAIFFCMHTDIRTKSIFPKNIGTLSKIAK